MPQSRQCSMRSSGELVPKSDGRIGGGGERAGGGGGGGGDREGGGGGGTAFKTKLEIKSSHSSHQRLLGSNSVSPQLFPGLRFCNRMAANNFSFSSMHRRVIKEMPLLTFITTHIVMEHIIQLQDIKPTIFGRSSSPFILVYFSPGNF